MNNFNTPTGNAYNPSALDTGVVNPMAVGNNTITPTGASSLNPNQVQPSPINPGLFSNMNTINSLNPGSAYNQAQPIPPPNGVQTSITPALGLENQ